MNEINKKFLDFFSIFNNKNCKNFSELRAAYRELRDHLKALRKELVQYTKEENYDKMEFLKKFLVFYLSIEENGGAFLNSEEIVDNTEAMRVILQEIISIFLLCANWAEEGKIWEIISFYLLLNRHFPFFLNEIFMKISTRKSENVQYLYRILDLIYFYQTTDLESFIKNTKNFSFSHNIFFKKMKKEMRSKRIAFLIKSCNKNNKNNIPIENLLLKMRPSNEEDDNEIMFLLEAEEFGVNSEKFEKKSNSNKYKNETQEAVFIKQNINESIIKISSELKIDFYY